MIALVTLGLALVAAGWALPVGFASDALFFSGVSVLVLVGLALAARPVRAGR